MGRVLSENQAVLNIRIRQDFRNRIKAMSLLYNFDGELSKMSRVLLENAIRSQEKSMPEEQRAEYDAIFQNIVLEQGMIQDEIMSQPEPKGDDYERTDEPSIGEIQTEGPEGVPQ